MRLECAAASPPAGPVEPLPTEDCEVKRGRYGSTVDRRGVASSSPGRDLLVSYGATAADGISFQGFSSLVAIIYRIVSQHASLGSTAQHKGPPGLQTVLFARQAVAAEQRLPARSRAKAMRAGSAPTWI
jgi:hypothetical protein